MAHLANLFRSTEETIKPEEAQVKGNLPNWLKGSYLRVGPGVFDIKDFTMRHWCDGFGVVYKFNICDGKVLYSKRIIQSDAYKKACSVGRPVFTELGTKAYTDTDKNIFQKMVSNVIPDLTDNVGVNLFKLGDAVYLATETCNLRILNPENLKTDKKVDISNYVTVNRLCSHVFKDPDGTAYTMGSAFTNNFKNQIIKIPPNKSANHECKKARSICTIPNRFPKSNSYAHSFGMTENYIVYIEQPYFASNIRLMTAHIKGRSLLDCMEWNPEECTRFILINKETGTQQSIIYESDVPFFFLHVINCYEKDNEVIVDVVANDSPKVMEKLYMETLRKLDFELDDQGAARRYVLPLANDIQDLPEDENLVKNDDRAEATRRGDKVVVKGHRITAPNYDFPSLNSSYISKEYTYFYASGLFGLSIYRGCVLKVNVRTGEVNTWKEDDDAIPGEAAFVPRPGGTGDEDDGVLVVGITDTREGRKDFLVIIDARTMTEVARAEVNAHVPHLIHALFLPNPV